MNRDDRGSVALLTLMGGVLVLGLALLAIAAAIDLTLTHARAGTAADAAALAAGAASPLAGGADDPERAASLLAARNDAQLDHVDISEWPVGVAVRATTRPRLPLLRDLVPLMGADAAAAVVPP